MAKSLTEHLKDLYERDVDILGGQKDKLKKTYDNLPDIIDRTAKLMNIAPELLVKYAVQTSWNENRPWYEVIFTLNTFYVCKRTGEKEQSAKEL